MMQPIALFSLLVTLTIGNETAQPTTASPTAKPTTASPTAKPTTAVPTSSPTAAPTINDRCHFDPTYEHLECCPTLSEQASYDPGTRTLSAEGYVKPVAVPKSFPTKEHLMWLGKERATLDVAKMGGGVIFETTIDMDDKYWWILVDGIDTLVNPIFGTWNETRQDWVGSDCSWDAVTNYLNGGGRGLRLRRENNSTLTLTDLDDGSVIEAQPANNTDEIYVVFTDNVEVQVSLPQATVAKVFLGPGGFLTPPAVKGYKPGVCWVTKRGPANMETVWETPYVWAGDDGTRANVATDCSAFQWSWNFRDPTASPTLHPTLAPSRPPTDPSASSQRGPTLVAIILALTLSGAIFY